MALRHSNSRSRNEEPTQTAVSEVLRPLITCSERKGIYLAGELSRMPATIGRAEGKEIGAMPASGTRDGALCHDGALCNDTACEDVTRVDMFHASYEAVGRPTGDRHKL